jgi:serine/threonine-protein kinase RsbW
VNVGGVEAPDDGIQQPVAELSENRQTVTTEFVRRGVPGEGAHLALVRRELKVWASTVGLSVPDADGLLLASYEALANAAEHAYSGHGPRVVDLVATKQNGYVEVTVRDYGCWRPEPADPGFRGRGLLMIRNLAHDAEIRKEPDGTTVRMRWPLALDH